MKLIIYCNVLICVMTLTFTIFTDFNVTNTCIFVNANHAKKILADCLINRAQKNKHHLFFHDFTESARDIFN